MRQIKWILPFAVFILLSAGCARHTPVNNEHVSSILRVAVIDSVHDMEQQKEINKLIRQYMRANYVDIETYLYTTADLLDNPLTELSADIIVLPTREKAIYLDDMQAIKHLDEVVSMNSPNMDMLLYKSALLNAQWHGHLLGIPRTIDPNVVAYNIDHFKTAKVVPNPEWDWNEYIQASIMVGNAIEKNDGELKSTLSDKNFRQKAGVGAATFDLSSANLLTFLLSNGGGIIDDNDIINIDSAASITALNWLQEQITQGRISEVTSVHLALSNDDASFSICPLTTLNQLNANKLLFKVLPAPKSPSTLQSKVTTTASLYVVNTKSPNMDLAIDFLIASLKPKVQAQTAVITGHLPVRKDAALPNRPWLPSKKIISSILDNALPQIPPYIGGRHIWAPVKSNMSKLSNGGNVNDLVKTIAQELRTIITLKSQPLKRVVNKTNWFGVTTSPTEQAPSAPNFKGTTVKWFTTQRQHIPLVDTFNANQSNNGIYIYMVFPQRGEDMSTFVKKGLTEKTADIVDAYPFDVPSHLVQGLLMPLGKLSLGLAKSNHDGGILNQLKQSGIAYIFSISRGPSLVYTAQKTWDATGWSFPTKGWTWDEFSQWYIKAAAANSGSYALPTYTWTYIFYQLGGRLDTGPYAPAEQALLYISSLQKLVPIDPANIISPDSIISRKAVATIKSTTFIPSNYNSIEQATLTVLPLPTINAEVMGSGNSTNHIAISARAPHPDAALQFLNWLYSEKGSQAYASLKYSYVPLTIYPAFYELKRAFWGPYVEYLFPVPFFCFDEMNSYLGKVHNAAISIAGDYFAGKSTLKQAVHDLETTLPRIAQGLN